MGVGLAVLPPAQASFRFQTIIYGYRLKLEQAICTAYRNLVGRWHWNSNLLYHLSDASYLKSKPGQTKLSLSLPVA